MSVEERQKENKRLAKMLGKHFDPDYYTNLTVRNSTLGPGHEVKHIGKVHAPRAIASREDNF